MAAVVNYSIAPSEYCARFTKARGQHEGQLFFPRASFFFTEGQLFFKRGPGSRSAVAAVANYSTAPSGSSGHCARFMKATRAGNRLGPAQGPARGPACRRAAARPPVRRRPSSCRRPPSRPPPSPARPPPLRARPPPQPARPLYVCLHSSPSPGSNRLQASSFLL